MPDPIIKKPFEYFNVVTYTGNGSTQSITGVGFQPDFVWIKDRSNGTYYHALFDSVRGASKVLSSNATNAEITDSARLNAFNSDGFTVGSDAGVNANGDSYVAWCWKANGTGVTNTAGSITSTVSANTTSGFSVVTYTGNGTSGATVGHGLGVAPSWIIIKNRSISCEWMVGTSYTNTSTPWGYPLHLNLTNARGGSTDAAKFNNTAPSSSVFTLGNGSETNGSGNNIVAYCFSEVAGFSKFGSYTGNGSSDGTFVALPFKPKFIMVKGYTGTSSDTTRWTMIDGTRAPYNATDGWLYANLSNAEGTGLPHVDFLSNGFKFRDNNLHINQSGISYIYMAFAEVPQKFSLGR